MKSVLVLLRNAAAFCVNNCVFLIEIQDI